MMISWDHVSQYNEWPSQWSYFYGFKCTILTARWWRDRDVVLVHIGEGPEVTNSSGWSQWGGAAASGRHTGAEWCRGGAPLYPPYPLYPPPPGVTNCPRSWSCQLQLGTVVTACLVQIVLLCQDFQSLIVIDCVILVRLTGACSCYCCSCSMQDEIKVIKSIDKSLRWVGHQSRTHGNIEPFLWRENHLDILIRHHHTIIPFKAILTVFCNLLFSFKWARGVGL